MDAARIDHLVVAAPRLDEGRWIPDTLGVAAAAGGRHPDFGTHNALVSLGDCYLEIIAIDPDAPAPVRPRWFELDTLDLSGGPGLIHWVAAVPALAGDGVMELSRGANRWLLTVAEDGRLPGGGVAPSLIHWLTPPPAASLPDAGLRLERLTLTTPAPDALRALLADLALADDRIEIVAGPARVAATIWTPSGPVEL